MGAKSDVAVKLVLVFFISLLSFSIGTYIGKKYSDNQHKLAQLEPSATTEKRSVASEGEGTAEATHGEATAPKEQMISDDEIKTLADDKLKKEEFIADDTEGDDNAPAHGKPAAHGEEHGKVAAHGDEHAKPAPAHGEVHAVAKDEHATKEVREPATKTKAHHPDPHAEAPHAAAETPHGHGGPEAAAHSPAAKPAPKHGDAPLEAAESFLEGKVPEAKAAPKAENRLPSSLPKDISQYALGKFTVQVASYNTKEEAEKRALKLKDQGYQTNVFPAKVADKMWYRVSFGLYGTNEEAQAERTRYLEKYKAESAIIQKIKN